MNTDKQIVKDNKKDIETVKAEAVALYEMYCKLPAEQRDAVDAMFDVMEAVSD